MTEVVDKYQAYAEALLRNPDDTENLVNQFSLLTTEGDLANGKHYLYLARRAYEGAPNHINAAFNYGSALQRTGEYQRAADIYRHCLAIAPKDWKAVCMHHLGVAYRALNENEKAIEFYDKALAINPKASIKKDRAMALLASGKLYDGLKAFECRKELAEERLRENGGQLVAQQKLPAGVRHWKGEDLTGKTIVIYHEEGSGDFIQFSRFIPVLWSRNPNKILLTGPTPDLLDLVADQTMISGIVPLEGPFKSDYVIGSMSLPWRLGLDYIDVNGKPYMKSKAANIPLRGKLNVGLVWRGNPAYGMDAHRSIAFSEFCPLFDLNDVAFYSLQFGGAANEVTKLGFSGFVADLGSKTKNWRDTAKLIQALDVVVTVDTAVAHLAGALGKPVLMMITRASDWRWDRDSAETVWYDSMTVIRQDKQDEWRPCILRVREKLEAMLAGRRREAA